MKLHPICCILLFQAWTACIPEIAEPPTPPVLPFEIIATIHNPKASICVTDTSRAEQEICLNAFATSGSTGNSWDNIFTFYENYQLPCAWHISGEPDNSDALTREIQQACFWPVVTSAVNLDSIGEQSIRIKKIIDLRHYFTPLYFSACYEARVDATQPAITHINKDQLSYVIGRQIFVKHLSSPSDTMGFLLPGRERWIDFWTGYVYSGHTVISRRYTLDEYPVFIKEGSFMPVATKIPTQNDTIRIDIYTGERDYFFYNRPIGSGCESELTLLAIDSKSRTLSVRGSRQRSYSLRLLPDTAQYDSTQLDFVIYW